jgi:hypothetical protein
VPFAPDPFFWAKPLLGKNGEWVVRDDAWIDHLDRKGKLTVGYGGKEDHIGPELGFGFVIGDAYEEPVLIIKLAWEFPRQKPADAAEIMDVRSLTYVRFSLFANAEVNGAAPIRSARTRHDSSSTGLPSTPILGVIPRPGRIAEAMRPWTRCGAPSAMLTVT